MSPCSRITLPVMLVAVGLLVALAASAANAQPPPPGGGGAAITIRSSGPMPPPGAPTGPPGAMPGGPPGSQPGGGEGAKPGEGEKPGEGGKPPTPEGPIAVFIPQKPDGQKLISMSFDQADIDHVLKFMAEQSGKTIVKDPGVQTKVTIVSTAKITMADAFRVLSALLSVKGYAMIEDEEIVRIVPKKAATQVPGPIGVDGGARRLDQYVTQIVEIQHIDATKLKDDLKPLVPEEQGVLIANADTNTLVIVDTASNVNRLLAIIKELDTERAEALTYDVIPLKFADAEELATELKELFQTETPAAGNQQEQRRRMMMGMGGEGGPPGGPGGAQPGQGAQGLMSVKGQVKIVAEKRTNSLVISASAENVKSIKEIVAKIDVDLSPEIEAKFVPLKFADATTLADQINSLYEDPNNPSSSRRRSPFGGMFSFGFGFGGQQQTRQNAMTGNRVVPDVRTNSLVVTADKENMTQILDVIKQLDVPAQIAEVVKAIPLENAVADTVAETLTSLLQGSTRGRGFFFFSLFGQQNQGGEAPLDQLQRVNVVADAPTNTIILTGPKDTFEILEQIIKQLDRRVPQVYIEVLIVDVTLDKETRLGVQWSLIDRSLFGDSSASGTAGTLFEGLAGAGLPGLSYSLISNSIQAFLRTLEGRSNVEILSTPNIIATDNTAATITIGESIPYLAASQQTTVGGLQQTVEFIDVSTKLVVTPHVNQRETISLDVNQTVDALLSFDEKLLAPRIAKRQAQTTVEVSDGQSIIIGGIISKQRSLTIQGVPILRRLPIIGPLFEDKQRKFTRSELLVFLTPHIITDEKQAQAVTDARRAGMNPRALNDKEMQPLNIPPAPKPAKPAEPQPAAPQ
jgi:general secretion pathway protein D